MNNLYGVFRFKDDLTYPYEFTVDDAPALIRVSLDVPFFYIKLGDGVYKPYYGIEAFVSPEDRRAYAIFYYRQDGDKDLIYAPGVDGYTWDGWWGEFYRTIYAPNNIEINEYLDTWFSHCLEVVETYPSRIDFYFRTVGHAFPELYKTTHGNVIENLTPMNGKISELAGTEYEDYVVVDWHYYDGYTEYGTPLNGDVIFENTKLVAEIINAGSEIPINQSVQGYVGHIMGWGVNKSRLEILISRFFSGRFGDVITGLNLSDLILGAHVFPFTIDVFTNVACEHVNPITSALTTIWEPDGYCGRLTGNPGSLRLGKIYPRRFYNDFRDFLNDVYIYLPYLGYEKIPCDVFYKHNNWQLRLDVDLFSGKGSYYIEHDGEQYGFWSVQIGLEIPIIKTDYNNSLRGALSNATAAIANLAIAKVGDSVSETIEAVDKVVRAPNIGVKTSVGDFSQSGMVSQPFIRYCRTVTNNVDNIEYCGRVCKQNVPLNRLDGYAEIGDVHLENINATQDELDEIVTLLKSGVIF